MDRIGYYYLEWEPVESTMYCHAELSESDTTPGPITRTWPLPFRGPMIGR